MPRSRKRPWLTCVFRADRTIAGDRPPRDGCQGRLPFTVGRWPVPRRASVEETTLAGVRFSRRSNDRGGQAPARRLSRPSPFHRRARACPSPCLGRGNGRGVRFSRSASDRGGQAPARRLSRPSPFHCRAMACPSPCLGRGNDLGWRSVFAQRERSRGTGPRATVKITPPSHRRARACPSPCVWLSDLLTSVGQDRLILTCL